MSTSLATPSTALALRARRDTIAAADAPAQRDRPLLLEISIGRIEARQPPSAASASDTRGATTDAAAGTRARDAMSAAANPTTAALRPPRVEITIGRIEVRQPPASASSLNTPGMTAATRGTP